MGRDPPKTPSRRWEGGVTMTVRPQLWAGCGQAPCGPAGTQEMVPGSADPSPVSLTDEAAVTRCFTKKTLCDWLAISTRTWDQAAAMGLTPAPDLIVSCSARWSPATVEKWLRTHPRLPGRGGKAVSRG